MTKISLSAIQQQKINQTRDDENRVVIRRSLPNLPRHGLWQTEMLDVLDGGLGSLGVKEL